MAHSEESHNGIAAVLKTADRKVVGVRVPLLPLKRSVGQVVKSSLFHSEVRGSIPLRSTTIGLEKDSIGFFEISLQSELRWWSS